MDWNTLIGTLIGVLVGFGGSFVIQKSAQMHQCKEAERDREAQQDIERLRTRLSVYSEQLPKLTKITVHIGGAPKKLTVEYLQDFIASATLIAFVSPSPEIRDLCAILAGIVIEDVEESTPERRKTIARISSDLLQAIQKESGIIHKSPKD